MIVDILCTGLPDSDAAGAVSARNAQLVGYTGHFQRRAHYQSPRNENEVWREARAARVAAGQRVRSPESLKAFLDEAGVDLAIISAAVDPFADAKEVDTRQRLAEFCATDRDRYAGMCWIDPFDDDAALQVDHLVTDLGIEIIAVGHTSLARGLTADHPRLGQIYGRCQSLGVPVSMGSAVNWYRKVPYDLFHPRYIDSVAAAFPDLKIIAAHGGWPWVADMVMVAWRHDNVYIDISTNRAGQFVNPALGWEPLLHFGDRVISDRVLFGSAGATSGADLASLIQQVRDLPLREATIEKWLGVNALRVLGRS